MNNWQTKKYFSIKLGILALLVTLTTTMAYSEPVDLGELKENVQILVKKAAIASVLANMQSMETSTGTVGGFPHFGLGSNLATSVTSSEELAEVSQVAKDFSMSKVKTIPFMGASPNLNVRIGGPKFGKIQFPYELGIYAGGLILEGKGNSTDIFGIPTSLTTADGLKVTGFNLGLILRVPIFQEQRLIPGVTLGLMYGYTGSSLELPMDLSDALFEVNSVSKNGKTVPAALSFSDTTVNYAMHTNTIGLNFHASKLLLFIEPMFSISPFLSFTNTNANFTTSELAVYLDEDGDGNYKNSEVDSKMTYNEYKNTYGNLTSSLDILGDGFSILDNSVYGGLNITSGFGLRIWKIYTDFLVSYEPVTQTLSTKIGSAFNY